MEQLKPTKRCLREAASRQYLTPNGGWTADIGQARDFPSVFQALVALAAEAVKKTKAPGSDFLDHFGATDIVSSAAKESIIANMSGSVRSGPDELDTLRAALPGSNAMLSSFWPTPNMRPTKRNGAVTIRRRLAAMGAPTSLP